MSRPIVTISAAVEGLVDDAVARRLIREAGAEIGVIHIKNGKPALHAKAKGYAMAAQFNPWLVLVDLDQDYDCAPLLRKAWLDNIPDRLCFRVAVREVEAWLLADSQGVARFLGVPAVDIPVKVEAIGDPKAFMIQLAQRSAKRILRNDMVPRPGSGRMVGPAYSSRLMEFAQKHWEPEEAAKNSESLRGCLDCLVRLAKSS